MRMADDFKNLYPEIEQAVRMVKTGAIVKGGGEPFREDIFMVEENFFKVFSFPILKGNHTAPLDHSFDVVLSKEMAAKVFPGQDAIGQPMEITRGSQIIPCVVSAVFDNKKGESSLVFDIILPFAIYKQRYQGKFMMTSFHASGGETYIQLKKGINYKDFNKKLALAHTHLTQLSRKGKNRWFFLQPLARIHLHHYNAHTLTTVGFAIYSYILSGLGLLVLIIACINFLTSSLGRVVKRSRDVGIRKVVGASRKQLSRQYLGEALLISTIALIGGIVLARVFLPTFNLLASKSIPFQIDFSFLTAVVLITLGVGLMAGLYPAVVLSRFQPVKVLRGSAMVRGRGYFNKTLVIVQFVFSAFLIISTLVMRQQLNFMREVKLGFDQERLVELGMNSRDDKGALVFQRFKNEVKYNDNILAVSAAATPFGGSWTWLGVETPEKKEFSFHYNLVDPGYVKTMGMDIVDGRDFSGQISTDQKVAVIVNQTFVKQFGQLRSLNELIPGKFANNPQIIGVVKDFHHTSLHQEIKPMVFTLSYDAIKAKVSSLNTPGWPPSLDTIVLRIGPGDPRPVLDFIAQKWRLASPGSPQEIRFVDDTLNTLYQSEQNWGRIVNYSSIFAILIAALGLFGLSMLAAEKRIKEIGIRKVLGAATGRLVLFFGKDLLRLVVVANIIAWPLALYAMDLWLKSFAYRITLNPLLFVFAALLTLVIAALTISYQTLKAAFTNPVDTVKYE